ncbi:MAG: two-component regulator propeller domain-containing protein [Bacteroidota bacterium]
MKQETTMAVGMRLRMLLLLSCVNAGTATSATGTWRNFTSMKNVTGVTRDSSLYWAASSGGMYSWDPVGNVFQMYTNAEGLRTIDLTAIGIDADRAVWTGSTNGVLHRLSPANGTIRLVLDIANANQTNKRINSLPMSGDSMLICTAFGLSVFRIDRFEFGDTYTRFGDIPSDTRTAVLDAAIQSGRIWATISDGQAVNRIAHASLSNPNLLPPESWTLEEAGPPGSVPGPLQPIGVRLFTGTTTGLYERDETGWVAVQSLAGKNIIDLAEGNGSLLVCTASGEVFTVDAGGNATLYGGTLPYAATSLASSAGGEPLVGSTGGGILAFETSWTPHLPNGPNGNRFVSVTVDPDGAIWCGSGSTNGSGLFRYDGNEWTSFVMANSTLPTDDIYRVSATCDGAVWASSHGRGVVEIPYQTLDFDSTDVYGTNVGMVGIPGDLTFVVPSNVVCDASGNTWTTTALSADRRVLTARRSDGSWLTLPAIVNGVTVSTLTDVQVDVDRCLAVDAFDNLWSVVRDGAFKGVVSFGNRGTVDSVAAFHVTAANGLPSDDIRTIVVDGDNDIWVGTSKGIGIILDPSNPLRPGGIASYRPLNGLTINTIAVDPLNRKWVGTTEGAILLSPDGTQAIEALTVESTAGKLISNDIKSIGVDPLTGTVYFGTASGLASLTTSAVAPKQSFEKLVIYPNPYLVPNAIPLSVDGLVENSSIRILSIDGTLVRDLQTPGGRIGFWDGKDEAGNDVSSGIYIVVGYSEDGTQIANGKVAVLRR